MAYCPEDGTEMAPVREDTNTVCYDCQDCESHWTYDGERGPGYFLSDQGDCTYCSEAARGRAL